MRTTLGGDKVGVVRAAAEHLHRVGQADAGLYRCSGARCVKRVQPIQIQRQTPTGGVLFNRGAGFPKTGGKAAVQQLCLRRLVAARANDHHVVWQQFAAPAIQASHAVRPIAQQCGQRHTVRRLAV